MNRDAGPCREAGRSGRRAGSRHPAARREGSRAGGGRRTLPAQALVPVGHGLREGVGAAPRVGQRSEPQKRGHASAILGVRRRGDKGITLGIRRSHAGHRMAVVVAMAAANSSNSHAGRFVPPYAVVVQGEEERSCPPASQEDATRDFDSGTRQTGLRRRGSIARRRAPGRRHAGAGSRPFPAAGEASGEAAPGACQPRSALHARLELPGECYPMGY